MTEDEMVGWHHRPNGHGFEQALGGGEGQESLACCSPRGHKESEQQEQLNNKSLRLQDWVASGQTINREGVQPHPLADN